VKHDGRQYGDDRIDRRSVALSRRSHQERHAWEVGGLVEPFSTRRGRTPFEPRPFGEVARHSWG
jgi:hypothetical protein